MSEELRATAKHTGVYGVASLLNRGVAFLLIPVYTRFLPPEDYGMLGLIVVTAEVVGTLLGMGIALAMSRIYFDYTGESERNRVVTTAILGFSGVIAVFLSMLPLVAEPLARIALGSAEHGGILALGIAGLLLHSVFTLGLQYLRIRQKSGTFLIASTLRSLVYVGLVAWFVVGLSRGVRGALTGILLANIVTVSGLVVPILIRHGARFSPARFRAMLRFGLPVLPGSLAEFLINFTDRYLVVRLVSLSAAGVYFLGFRFGTLLYALLIVPFGMIYVVRRFEAFGQESGDPEARRLFTYFFLIMVSAALALAVLAPEVVRVVAAPSYAGAGAIIPIVALTQVTISLLLIVQLGIYYQKKTRHLMTTSLAMFAVHVPLNFVLISAFGIVGAAAAGFFSALFKVALTVFVARNLGGPVPEWRRLFAILFFAVLAFALARATHWGTDWLGLVCRGVIAVVFPFAVLRTPVFRPEERAAFGGFLRMIRSRGRHGESTPGGSQ